MCVSFPGLAFAQSIAGTVKDASRAVLAEPVQRRRVELSAVTTLVDAESQQNISGPSDQAAIS